MSLPEDDKSLAYLDEHQAVNLPTLQQRAAISTLRTCGISRVLAWLEIMCSLEPEYHHLFRTGCLDRQHLDALFVLATCHNHQVAAWLQLATSEVHSDPPDIVQPPGGATQSFATVRHNTAGESSMQRRGAGPLTTPSPDSQRTSQVMPRRAWSEVRSFRGSLGQPLASEDISDPFNLHAMDPSYRQARLPSLHNNEHPVNRPPARPLIDTGSGCPRYPFQSLSGDFNSDLSNCTYAMSPEVYLNGVGAWQAGSTPGFINSPSAALEGGNTDDPEPQAYYPELSDI